MWAVVLHLRGLQLLPSPTQYFFSKVMAGAVETQPIYMQADFVPPNALEAWNDSGNTLGAVNLFAHDLTGVRQRLAQLCWH